MSKARREAGQKVATALFDTEKAIDEAMAKAAMFLGAMPVARQEARLSAVVGQDAIDKASDALMRLNEARRAIVEAHNALFDVQKLVGLGEVNFGGVGPKPEARRAEQPAAQVRPLRIVRPQAA